MKTRFRCDHCGTCRAERALLHPHELSPGSLTPVQVQGAGLHLGRVHGLRRPTLAARDHNCGSAPLPAPLPPDTPLCLFSAPASSRRKVVGSGLSPCPLLELRKCEVGLRSEEPLVPECQ